MLGLIPRGAIFLNRKVTVFQVAGTYIGTIVGAGFASGQEILQFFVSFSIWGIAGLFAITILFIYFGYIIMELGWKLNATSHLPIVQKVGGRVLGSFSDIVITFFLFGALTAMIAGSGALFHQEFNLHPITGSLLMASITVITVLGGFNSIIKSISMVAPFLILSALSVSIISILSAPPLSEINISNIQKPVLLRNWLWSAILYISYNIVPSISILGPLGRETQNRKTIRKGAIFGGIGLGIGAAAIFLTLYVNAEAAENLEVPMIMIARRISPVAQVLYSIVLLAEIYTSAVGDLYGFASRICDMKTRKATCVILISSVLAFGSSLAGFSNLVRYLYPTVGYCGVLTLICLIYNRYKR
ncbi:MAG: hypothetical protein GX227_05270 [Clostridiaceae bacterium]|nr:hypothetical protein [Clostridiaceae bacterium]